MKNRSLPPLAILMLATAAVIALMALSACGVGAGDVAAPELASPPSAQDTAETQTATPITPLQFDDDGNYVAVDPHPKPADTAASSPEARAADLAQAHQLAQALGVQAIEIDVECCTSEAIEKAVGLVWGLQAAQDLPPGTPILLRSADLRLAAAAASRLASGGLTNVWVVTP
jgi:hypothetical protein